MPAVEMERKVLVKTKGQAGQSLSSYDKSTLLSD